VSGFRRDRQPDPRRYYESIVGPLSRPNRKGYVAARCPFHRTKSGRSLAVNVVNGIWHCFGGCGGGDIVSFEMKLRGLRFKAAAAALGMWDDIALTPDDKRRIAEEARMRRRTEADEARSAAEFHSVRIAFRTDIHALDNIARSMKRRMNDPGLSADEHDLAGDVLWMTQGELRESIAAYWWLSFGSEEMQKRFLASCESERANILAEIQIFGFVRDDRGHIVEVGL